MPTHERAGLESHSTRNAGGYARAEGELVETKDY